VWPCLALAVGAGAILGWLADRLPLPVPLNQVGATVSSLAWVAFLAVTIATYPATLALPGFETARNWRLRRLRLVYLGLLVGAGVAFAASVMVWALVLGIDPVVAFLAWLAWLFLSGLALLTAAILPAWPSWIPGLAALLLMTVVGTNRWQQTPRAWAILFADHPTSQLITASVVLGIAGGIGHLYARAA
jgi:hypothetical protein